jgi:tetratricopeptide (TPR) repeat protein
LTISHYKIISKLGEGGMGEVWEAHDSRLDRSVAIKLIPKHLSADPAARTRFVHEAKAASSIEHANICTIFEIDETPEGETFIVMPRYQGELLSDRVARGRLPLDEALRIVEDLAGALAEAHDHDIIHRDVKPANIIIDTNERPILLDFGLAKLTEHTKVTKTGTTVGTLAYMAPEQAAGKDVDGRADLFSLGVVLYELVAGVRPFRGEHDAAVLYSIAHEPAAPLASHDPSLPAPLQTIIDRSLAKEPNERYANLHDLRSAIADLRRQLQGASTSSQDEKPVVRSRPRWMLPAVALVVVLAALAVWKFLPRGANEASAEEYSIAVVDFRDLTSPDDLTVSAGVTELVNIGLIENCPIRVVSPEYLRDLRRRLFGSGRGPIEDDQVIEVAREAGAILLLAGRIGDAGENRFVTWRLVDTRSGESVGARKVEGEGLTLLADRIIAGVLPLVVDVCGVEKTGSTTAVDRITTESEEAYQHFAAGLMFKDQIQGIQARDELEKAVAIDSTFALAHLELARLHWGPIGGVKDFQKARRHLERARALESRLGLKDRLRLDATRFDQAREFSRTVAAYEGILRRWPDDRETLKDLANLFFRFWDHRLAATVAKQGLELYPEDPTFGSLYPQVLQYLGQLDKAMRITRGYVGRYSTDPNAWDDLALRFLGLGMPDSAEVAARRTLELDPRFGTGGGLPQCAYARGDLKRAISLTEQYLTRGDLPASTRVFRMIAQTGDFGLSSLYREAGRYHESIDVMEDAKQYSHRNDSRSAWAVGNALLYAGRAKEALDVAHSITTNYEDPRAAFYALRIRAWATVALGDLGAARAAGKQLRVAEDQWGGLARALSLTSEAEIALAENKPDEALDTLDKIKSQGVGSGGLFDITYREARARAHRMAGRLDEAAAVHKELLRVYGGHALSYYALGQIYEEMSRPAEATREFSKFLEMWAKADEGLPQLVDARERLDALTGKTP